MQSSNKKPTMSKASRREEFRAATNAVGGLLDFSGRSALATLTVRPARVIRRKRGGLVSDARVLRKEAVAARQTVMAESRASRRTSEKFKK